MLDIGLSYTGNNTSGFITQIKQHEASLLSQHTSQQMEVPLLTSSVLRYSLAYWDDRVSGTNGPQAKGKFWKKLFAAVAEAVGAVAGADTVVSGVGGAIVGAAAASTGAAKIYDIFAE